VSVNAFLVEVLKCDRAICRTRPGGSGDFVVGLPALDGLGGCVNMDVGMEMIIAPAMQHWTAKDLV